MHCDGVEIPLRKDAERETVKLQHRFQTADKLRMGVKNSAAVSHM